MLKNKKILSLIGLFILMSLFSISCSSKQDPTKIKPIDLVGRWNCTDAGGEAVYFTISDTGYITLSGQTDNIPILNWDTVKNTEQDAPYKLTYGESTFSFTSESDCEATTTSNPAVLHFKKQ